MWLEILQQCKMQRVLNLLVLLFACKRRIKRLRFPWKTSNKHKIKFDYSCHAPPSGDTYECQRRPRSVANITARSEGFGMAQCCLRDKTDTYEILAQTLHLHVYVLAGTTRQSLQTRSWHSTHRSPRSKMRPKVLRQRAHWRCPTSWGRWEPFCLISSSSFFSLLFDRKSRTSGDDEKSGRESKRSNPSPHRILFSSCFLSFSSFCSTFRMVSRSCSSRKEKFSSSVSSSIGPSDYTPPVNSAKRGGKSGTATLCCRLLLFV